MSVETIKKIEHSPMLLLWEINERVEYANELIRGNLPIDSNDKKMFAVDNETLVEFVKKQNNFEDAVAIWATNLHKKIDILLEEESQD